MFEEFIFIGNNPIFSSIKDKANNIYKNVKPDREIIDVDYEDITDKTNLLEESTD